MVKNAIYSKKNIAYSIIACERGSQSIKVKGVRMFNPLFTAKVKMIRELAIDKPDTCHHGVKQSAYDVRMAAKDIAYDLRQASVGVWNCYSEKQNKIILDLASEFLDIANPCYTCVTEY